MSAILVVAKAPVAGFAKTRLTPPLASRDGARLAAAALLDTLAAAIDCADRVFVAFTGDLRSAERADDIEAALRRCEVFEQRGDGFAARLVNAHLDAASRGSGPVLQIGMDTPQANSATLGYAAEVLDSDGVDCVLGPAADGGWWALGVRDAASAQQLLDVPMSTEQTCAATRAALQARGDRVRDLSTLVDVDEYADIATVAADPNCGKNFRAIASELLG